MERQIGGNSAEKQRLRDSIAEQVRHFLENGGRVTVLESPLREGAAVKGGAWDGEDLTDFQD
jgi:hypothetical protein